MRVRFIWAVSGLSRHLSSLHPVAYASAASASNSQKPPGGTVMEPEGGLLSQVLSNVLSPFILIVAMWLELACLHVYVGSYY